MRSGPRLPIRWTSSTEPWEELSLWSGRPESGATWDMVISGANTVRHLWDIPDIVAMWATRLARVRRSQERTDTRA
jgi:hypothetical protein